MNRPQSLGSPYPLRRLGDIAEFLDAKRRKLPAHERRSGAYPFYGAAGQQGTIDQYLFDEPLVLLAQDSSGSSASVQCISGRAWVSHRVHVLRPRAGVDHEFLRRALEQCARSSRPAGSNRRTLTRKRAAECLVPVPELGEQRRIAEVLARADALSELRRGAPAQLDAFLRVLFLERFGDPATNPWRWPQLPFGALGAVAQATFTGARLLVAADGGNLITRQHAVARVVRGELAVDQHTHVIAANGRAELDYLAFVIELTELKPYLTGTAVPKLRRVGLERVSVPVPPLELQCAFCQVVESVEALRRTVLASSQRLDELSVALRRRAFAGELQFNLD